MTLWFISDTHFGHWNMVHKFVLKDGTFARKFESVEEMDELMIANWNAVVKPSDHIYHLGDVTMKQQELDKVMPRLNGHKRLVRGNHDTFKTKLYAKYFEEIHGTRLFDGLIFSHIPIAPWSFARGVKANVHGHVHQSEPLVYQVMNPRGPEGFAKQVTYINLCVERTNYKPVTLETIQGWIPK